MFPRSFRLDAQRKNSMDMLKNSKNATQKLLDCIDYHYDDFSLGELIAMFSNDANDFSYLFSPQLNPLQTLVSVIVFCLIESRMPNNIELDEFLVENGVDTKFNTEDFCAILNKFGLPGYDDNNTNPSFDLINFGEIKNKIQLCNTSFSDESNSNSTGHSGGYSPVVQHFLKSLDPLDYNADVTLNQQSPSGK